MPAGRPPALDEVKRRELCALLSAGLEFVEAARYVGCTPRTIRREIQRCAAFRRAVQDALQSARQQPEKILRQAAGRNWRAAAWLLERTNPQGYGRRSPIVCTPDDIEAVCRWLTNAAMNEAPSGKQKVVYAKLTAITRLALGQIHTRTKPNSVLKVPPTALYDFARLLEGVSSGHCPPDDSAHATPPADKIRPHSVPSGEPRASANEASTADDGGQNSGILSAQTYFSPADKIRQRDAPSPPRDAA